VTTGDSTDSSAPNNWYSGRGYDGKTELIGGKRVPKFDLRPEAIGQVDELQAVLGLCRAGPLSQKAKDIVLDIERQLYNLMAELAFPSASGRTAHQITADHVTWLETQTDELGQSIPAFTDFVVPGDSQASALINLARTVARRAERAVVHLLHGESASGFAAQYLNRLSSLLFVMVCYEDMVAGIANQSKARDI